MANTINADNGVSSGSAGLKSSSDGTGILALQTNGTTAVTVDASQNVGIGTASPAQKLQVVGQSAVSGANGGFLMYDRTTSVSSSQWYSPSAGVTRLYDQISATDRLVVDASGNLQFNSGYGSTATAYGCRAWVNFNGIGTVTIRASGNVSSITDNGVGDYTVNFTTAMPDASYEKSCTVAYSAGVSVCYATTDWSAVSNTEVAPTTSAFRLSSATGTTGVDSKYVSAAIFR